MINDLMLVRALCHTAISADNTTFNLVVTKYFISVCRSFISQCRKVWL